MENLLINAWREFMKIGPRAFFLKVINRVFIRLFRIRLVPEWLLRGSFNHYYSGIMKRMERELGNIQMYNNVESRNQGPIWFCWLQGLENAPQIVQVCYSRLKKRADREVVLITNENVSDYIFIPEKLTELLKEEKISWAHYSDYLRYELLAVHGGMWIDATCFLINDIPESIFNSTVYYPGNLSDFTCLGVGDFQFPFVHEFVNYCIASPKNGTFVSAMAEATLQCIYSGWGDVDYYFGFVLSKIIREKLDIKLGDNVAKNNVDAELLGEELERGITPNQLEDLFSCTNSWMFKLSTNPRDRLWLNNSPASWEKILEMGK